MYVYIYIYMYTQIYMYIQLCKHTDMSQTCPHTLARYTVSFLSKMPDGNGLCVCVCVCVCVCLYV